MPAASVVKYSHVNWSPDGAHGVTRPTNASAALAASGVPQGGMNYAVKSSLLLSFLESVPEVDAKIKAPNTADEKFEDVVKSAEQSTVLVLVY